MTGLEKMLASMLGITPEQMTETIGNAIQLLQNLDGRLSNIESKVNELHALAVPVIEEKQIEQAA